MDRPRDSRRDQSMELGVLLLLYVLQVANAEMLRRSIGNGTPSQQPVGSLVVEAVRVISNLVHPMAMVVLGVWFALMAVAMARGRRLPRWSFDGPGAWLCIRLVLEFVTINALIFQPSLVPPGVLLGQIVVYLPYFVLSWGWIFHRLDWVNRPQPGAVIQLGDAAPQQGISRFDYFHSAINSLLNKGKPTITGVTRAGRIAVLLFSGMLLGLYAVAFTRVLQLTKAAL